MARFNIALPTLGGQIFWTDQATRNGWRVQRHALTGHARLIDPRNRCRAWGPLADVQKMLAARAHPSSSHNHAVVLVHGLGGNSLTFLRMKRALVADGHHVVSFKYASAMTRLDDQATALATFLPGIEADTLTLIGQSMGGLVIDRALRKADPRVTGIIRIGTPCGGSAFAASILNRVGPSRLRLTPLADVARGLPPDAPSDNILHINIAGRLNGARGRNPSVRGEDDGLVGVAEVMRHEAHLTSIIAASHYGLTSHPATIATVRAFIAHTLRR